MMTHRYRSSFSIAHGFHDHLHHRGCSPGRNFYPDSSARRTLDRSFADYWCDTDSPARGRRLVVVDNAISTSSTGTATFDATANY